MSRTRTCPLQPRYRPLLQRYCRGSHSTYVQIIPYFDIICKKETHHFQINKSDEFFYYNSGKISGKESTDLSDESIAIIYFSDNFA